MGIGEDRRSGEDSDGNPIYAMEVEGVQLCVVVALDDGVTVITLYDREA